jgi:hypothetical protein
MSAKLISAAQRDDAAFRARLAPLASEVLPQPRIIAAPRRVRRPLFRRFVVVIGATIVGAAMPGATWLIFKSPWSEGPVHVAASAPAAPAPVSLPSPVQAVAPGVAHVDMIVLLQRRGDAALADGDIIAARLLFERAAALGSATAATAAGKTYDSDFLSQAGARGIQPDQTAAAAWFRKAVALGDPEALARLLRIEGQNRP